MISNSRHDFVGIIGKNWLYQIVLVTVDFSLSLGDLSGLYYLSDLVGEQMILESTCWILNGAT
ncbi:hypothetical protein MHIR_DE00112 [Candidatus Doolittlea endobia]|uniref:Uncharacterized protein n=1 Tax=Candidatus Doolittlea endobia TaxID=1778262 RepID=A0A143WRT0_9ENTR|nr:hypothetical protein MHIR_DE00112 [Candidatus Doolittlea endobia]